MSSKKGAVASAIFFAFATVFLFVERYGGVGNKKILKKRIKIAQRKERYKNLFFVVDYSILKLSTMLQAEIDLLQFCPIFSCYIIYSR